MAISLVSGDYVVSAKLIGIKKEGAHVEQEFYFVPAMRKIFTRQRVNFPYGNNQGDRLFRQFQTERDPSIYYHPADTKEKLPEGVRVLETPEDVLLHVYSRSGTPEGKADIIRRGKDCWV
jgi:hypothetical protein